MAERVELRDSVVTPTVAASRAVPLRSRRSVQRALPAAFLLLVLLVVGDRRPPGQRPHLHPACAHGDRRSGSSTHGPPSGTRRS